MALKSLKVGIVINYSITDLCVKINVMNNQLYALNYRGKQIVKRGSTKDSAYYTLGLFTFVVFVLAMSTLVIINLFSVLQ